MANGHNEILDLEFLDDTQPENFLSMDADVAMAWQYHDEIEYQERLAISYPVDSSVIFAQNWLKEQGI